MESFLHQRFIENGVCRYCRVPALDYGMLCLCDCSMQNKAVVTATPLLFGNHGTHFPLLLVTSDWRDRQISTMLNL